MNDNVFRTSSGGATKTQAVNCERPNGTFAVHKKTGLRGFQFRNRIGCVSTNRTANKNPATCRQDFAIDMFAVKREEAFDRNLQPQDPKRCNQFKQPPLQTQVGCQ
jgi:hypothetical protein